MQEFAALLLLLLLLCPTARGEEGPVTRGGFVSALWESAGAVPYDAQTPFSDVSPRADYAPAVSWAAHQGLVLGTGEGRFQPERPITREEAAVLLRRWGNYLGRDTGAPLGLSLCNDNEGISPWADDSLYWATSCGLIEWSPGGLLDPQGTLTATQAQAVLERFSRGFGDAHA